MSAIQIEIEGENAIEASMALMQIEGIDGHWEEALAQEREAATLTAIATIVGLVGGTMAIAEQIRKWYQEFHKGRNSKTIDKVLIVTPQNRLLLENATVEEIAKALEPLVK